MNTEIISLVIFGCVVGAVLIGRALNRRLPQDHLSADTKETVKLAMGLLATMSALLLGLLVASAKGSYDNARNEVIQMAAKVVFLNRVWARSRGSTRPPSRGGRRNGSTHAADQDEQACESSSQHAGRQCDVSGNSASDSA